MGGGERYGKENGQRYVAEAKPNGDGDGDKAEEQNANMITPEKRKAKEYFNNNTPPSA